MRLGFKSRFGVGAFYDAPPCGWTVGSSRIGPGVPALVGFEADRSTDLEWMARRLLRRRVFGVDMQPSSIDDGPVTIIIDSKAAA